MVKEKERYLLVDGIRGFAIVNMVLFHFLYDVTMVYGKNPFWYALLPNRIWQQSICWTFILVTGFVWQWGRKSNLRRGLFLNLCGLGISLVTWLFVPGEAVRFGILNFIGCAVLLMIPLDKVFRRIPTVMGMAASFSAFLLFKNVELGYLGFETAPFLKIPEWLYEIRILTPFGFPYSGFTSSDYFPILPWFFLFLTGYFFQFVFAGQEGWKRAAVRRVPFLSAIGRNSIWIYLVHQPAVMLLCEVLL